ncbi:hypothetical protein BGM26_16860 [Bacillus sp. FJAT-29790]|uniref:hypothetical protein n=1 Tax=Bacillus sp. FJAT-29790 TaxID=1895002 RepID=UPI001C233B00|nr:hypothetical protein [Bacillus sp. FJAT-29790]MBU8880627.1 hypothetical protein [Bacillus sp. FJAT-29790]
MDYYNFGRYLNYLIKQIRDEKHFIIKDSENVSILVDELIEELQNMKKSSENTTSEIITHHSNTRIQEKLHKLFFQQQEINFRKQNIRNYKNEIFSINGFFKEEWE